MISYVTFGEPISFDESFDILDRYPDTTVGTVNSSFDFPYSSVLKDLAYEEVGTLDIANRTAVGSVSPDMIFLNRSSSVNVTFGSEESQSDTTVAATPMVHVASVAPALNIDSNLQWLLSHKPGWTESQLVKYYIKYDPLEPDFGIQSGDYLAMKVIESYIGTFETDRFSCYNDFLVKDKGVSKSDIANSLFSKFKYQKRTRLTTGATIYDNSSRPFVARALQIEPETIIEIENLIDYVGNELQILIYGLRVSRGDKQDKQFESWNRREPELKARMYGVMKRVLWNKFHFSSKIIEFLTRRYAYHVAQNLSKCKNKNSTSLLNKPQRKNILHKRGTASKSQRTNL